MKYLINRSLFISEELKMSQNVVFDFNDETFEFSSDSKKELYSKVVDWLYKSGYEFKSSNIQRQLLDKSKVDSLVDTTNMRYDKFHKVLGSDKYVITNFIKEYQDLISMLNDFGAKGITFNKSKKTDSEHSEKYTFSKAAQIILKENGNKPMTSNEIWVEISRRNMVQTSGSTPATTLNAQMLAYSDNSQIKRKFKTKLFNIVDKNPAKFILINPEEIQDVPEEEIQDVPDEEIESSLNIPAVRNPFGGESKEAGDDFDSSALFVVGESGSGKSTRILKVLRQNNHKLILIGAESAPSPNLLFDYDQSEGYILSDIAEFIISAKKDPKSFYTIIFDECHEYIDEIKRSILHAISTKRGEKRFFGVKKSVRQFFDDLETYETTSKIVPDNVGFIFISSKPDVFEYHADFMGRVDKVEVKREDPYPYPDLKYIQSKIDRQDQL